MFRARSTRRRRTSFLSGSPSWARLELERLEERVLLDASPYLPPSHFLSYSPPLTVDTGTASPAPTAIATAYLNTHAAELGLTAADVANPIVTSAYTEPDSGISHVYLRQAVNGLEVGLADLAIGIDPQGRVVTAAGDFVPGLANLLAGASIVPTLSAAEAARDAAADLGVPVQDEARGTPLSTGADEATTLNWPSLSRDPIPAHLRYVPTADGGAVLSWNLIIRLNDGQHWFDLSVDDASGHINALANWIDNDSPPSKYNVVAVPNKSPEDPTSPLGGFQLVNNPDDTTASPFGWHDTNGVTGAEFTDTEGNNVDAHLDTNADDVADAGSRPNGGASLDYSGLTLDPTQQPTTAQNQQVAVANLFYISNIIHDIHYHYGFTPVAGNFQVNNYGMGGFGNDAVQADAQDGSGLDNANFGTPPDGFAPRMQMFLFDLTAIMRDGDLDNEVMIHEYGHGVSNRLTGGPANASALMAGQSSGMGEGWSDFFALMFLQRSTDTQNAAYPTGNYVLGLPATGGGIRQFPYSFDMSIDPHTFGDYNTVQIVGFPPFVPLHREEHDVGEIWASTLWDLNWLLINKYGYDSNLYTGWAPGGGPASAGNKLALRLVEAAMALQPANPSFLDARDAILAADNLLNGGQDLAEIWTAFARRGLGANASTSDANSLFVTTDTTIPPGILGVTVTTTNTPDTYTENDPALVIDAGLGLSSTSSTTITQATVAITPTSFAGAQDVFAFTPPAGSGITGVANASAGILVLSGSATLADYQQALQSVTYFNTSDNPSAVTRTIIFTVTDDQGNVSNKASKQIVVVPVNDAPALTLPGPDLHYAEAQSATRVAAPLTLTDLDDPMLSGVSVAITEGFSPGQDILSFLPQNGISGVYQISSGVLALSGRASVAAYQQALNTITYFNASRDPSTTLRVVTVTVSDGKATTQASRDITITAVDDSPLVTLNGSPVSFTVGQPAALIDDTVAVADPDSSTFAGGALFARVAMNGQPTDQFAILSQGSGPGQVDLLGTDVRLGGVVVGTLAPSLPGGTLIVNLNANATPAVAQAILRTVTFITADQGGPRAVQFSVSDGVGGLSAPATQMITVVPSGPVLVASPGSVSYVENQAATTIDPGLVLSDVNVPLLMSATVSISANFAGQDVLTFTPQAGIAGAYDSSTGVLALTGSASLAAYQAVLNSVTYFNTGDNPGSARTITFTASDGVQTGSTNRAIAITAVNDPPTILVPGPQTINGDSALAFSAAGGNPLAINDPDAGNGVIQVSVSASAGSLSVASTTGLTFTQGTGTGSPFLSFLGTQPAVNAALAGLLYTPPPGFRGPVTLSVSANDQGSSGLGGPLGDSRSVVVTVRTQTSDLTLSNNTIPENTPIGTQVGLLTALPGDGAPFTFALVPGVGADDNASFTLIGNALRTNTLFNAAVQSTYHVRVRTTDVVGVSVEKPFTLTITPVGPPAGSGGQTGGGQTGGQTGGSTGGPSTPTTQTIVSFDPTTAIWYLRSSNGPGAPDMAPFGYGAPGWSPVTGDWNGDGTATIGVVDTTGRNSPFAVWYLRNSNGVGAPSYTPFTFGLAGWVPVVGDWTGSGHTGIGMFDPNTGAWFLRSDIGGGAVDVAPFLYGLPNWKPVAGDWNGDGIDGIGIFDPSTATWYLRNSNTPGPANIGPFVYGAPGWKPAAGDFGGNGRTGIAVVDPLGFWYIESVAGSPVPPAAFPFGMGSWTPLAANFFGPGHPLHAADVGSGAAALDDATLQSAVQATLGRLAAQGVDAATLQQLASARYVAANLPGTLLGAADPAGNQVVIDADAAGHGWFLDSTPRADEEFTVSTPGSPLLALPAGAAAGHEDLLSVLAHEMGHLAGRPDLDAAGHADDVMADVLATGTRRLDALDSVFRRGL